jgi:asparagine synthase (glutamine-hydrolysing)
MCGIVGIRAETLREMRGDFAAAMRALAWRGRDGSGSAQVGGWRLGVARLAITDPAAAQPIVCAHTGRVVVCNGAITSARAEWARYGEGRQTRNDAELPLLRLRHCGPGALAPQCGHYAFAVADPDGRLWLARDPWGEKPLWVVRRGARVLAFASTVAALRALGFVIDLPLAEVGHLLRLGWHFAPAIEGAGLTLEDAGAGVWEADGGTPVPQQVAPWPARSLRARVQAAVERCARAEVRVGLLLSGGIDSACLAACLRAAGCTDLPAFQFAARGEPRAERGRAQQVAEHTGMHLIAVDGGPELLRLLPALTAAHGLPVGDPSTLAAHAVALRAAQEGVKVLLSGEGGDELFFGYRRHRVAARMRRWQFGWLPLPDPLAHGYSARLRRALRARDVDLLLAVAPPGVAELALAPELRAVHPLPLAGDVVDPLERAITLDRQAYLRRDLLPKADLATLYAGVEGRCPFLDPEVAAAPEAELHAAARNLGKRALRLAFASELPRAVLRQGKTGFGLPLDRWLRQDDFLADILSDRRTLERPHVVAAGLRDLLDRHRQGRVHLGHALYLFAAYELYLRTLEGTRCPA